MASRTCCSFGSVARRRACDRGRGAVRGRCWFLLELVAVRVWLVVGDGSLVCRGAGEFGGAEGGVPDAVEVVLGRAQVQGERVVEQPEPGQGLLQAVDGAGGGLEVRVQVVGGGVVGGAFGERAPLLALAPPVEQVGAGQHELVAVVAVQVPRAGAAVDDGLEGAEPALGGGAAPRQVDRQRLGLLAGERGGVAGEQLAGAGGAGPGDPDVLQDVLQVGVGEVDVVLGHPVGDLARGSGGCGSGVAPARSRLVARVCRAWWGTQRPRSRLVDPGPEPAVEPLVGQRRPCRRGCGSWWGTAPSRARSAAVGGGRAGR